MSRWFTASWRGTVPTASALALGDPFEAKTWFYARQHACTVLGLSPEDVRIEEVEETHEPRDVEEIVEEDDEQASGVRLRTITNPYLVTKENENARWVCEDHPNAKADPYIDVMECSVCGHAMLPDYLVDDVAEGGER